MNILLLDAYSAAHVGNAALLDSSLLLLREAFPDARFSLHAKSPESYASHEGIAMSRGLFPGLFAPSERRGMRMAPWLGGSAAWMASSLIAPAAAARHWPRGPRRTALQQILEADLVVSISGEMLNDVFLRLLPFMLHTYRTVQRLGKPLVFFPQSVGPLESPLLRSQTRRILSRSALLCPRDPLSLAETQSLGVPSCRVRMVPDAAILQPMSTPAIAEQLLHEAGVQPDRRPRVGLTVSRFLDRATEKGERPYLKALSELAGHVIADLGGSVVLIAANHPAYGEEQDDLPVSREVHALLPEEARPYAAVTTRLYTPREFKALTACFDAYLTTRMHAGILATMAETPTIALSTQRKLRGFFQLLNLEPLVVEPKDASSAHLRELLHHCLDNREALRKHLATQRESLTPQVRSLVPLLQQRFSSAHPT